MLPVGGKSRNWWVHRFINERENLIYWLQRMFSLQRKSNTEKTVYRRNQIPRKLVYRGNQIQRRLRLQKDTEKTVYRGIKYRESSVYRGNQIQRKKTEKAPHTEEIKYRESSVYRGNQIQRQLCLQRKSNTEKAPSTEEIKFSVLNISDTKSYSSTKQKTNHSPFPGTVTIMQYLMENIPNKN